MKTAQEWMEKTTPPLYGSAIDRWIEAIQKDAFESGRVALQDDVVCRVEQALSHLEGAKSNHQYDPSWIRPRLLSRQEVNMACEQAYHQIHAILEQLQPKDTCSKNTP